MLAFVAHVTYGIAEQLQSGYSLLENYRQATFLNEQNL